ncbi:MAG: rhodanese-like domain-containing protein [Bacteroidetes bacterium]|nr:rhodanese-like domain-containing protein [Bacteroidota bacterium]MCB0845391.1 rhodanese-like domain-containing protein [Bacteroidota bacterium]
MQKKYLFGFGGVMVFIALVLIAISFDHLDPYSFRYSSNEMLEKMDDQTHLLSPQEFIDLRTQQDLIIVDLRDPKLFAAFSLDSAKNIAAERVLDKSLKPFFQTETTKVLVDQDGLQANQIWVLLTQFGYENLMVLEGGIKNWQEKVEVTTLDKFTGFKDEKPQVDFAEVMKK